MNKNIIIKFLIIFLVTLFFGRGVLAANLDFNVEKNIFKEDEPFTLALLLDTKGESINAIEGDLKYDENYFKIEAINIGGSFVSFWLDRPDSKTPGIVHFSGVTPGGVSGAKNEVFSIIFKTTKPGDTSLSLQNVNLFLNDGSGTTTEAKTNNLNIKINQEKSSDTVIDTISSDKASPEKFVVIRTKDKTIFNDKYFAVFSTVDKGSGVDHYKVCEFFKCTVAESPYQLWNQTPLYYISVSAYDLNSNVRNSLLISPYLILLVIAVVVVLLYTLCFRRFSIFNKV